MQLVLIITPEIFFIIIIIIVGLIIIDKINTGALERHERDCTKEELSQRRKERIEDYLLNK